MKTYTRFCSIRERHLLIFATAKTIGGGGEVLVNGETCFMFDTFLSGLQFSSKSNKGVGCAWFLRRVYKIAKSEY